MPETWNGEAVEPCSRCLEETASGSPLFSGRRRVQRDDQVAFICTICLEQLPGDARALSDDQIERLLETVAGPALMWQASGTFPRIV